MPNWLWDKGQASNNNFDKARGALAIIAFYFLLRVGEYTVTNKDQGRHTVQFRIRDITLYHNNTILPKTRPLHDLLTATGATMQITEQKNGVKNDTIHHQAFHDQGCLGRALITQIHHILTNGGNSNTIISAYATNEGLKVLTGDDMVHGIREAVKALGLQRQGYQQYMVGSHSLRSGGAMVMKLNNVDRDVILKVG